jgi:hypothetical protein
MSLTSNSASRIISQKFKIEQCALAARPAAENLLPATLLLEAVCESDVDVLQGEVILRQLLETQNDGILRGILNPGSLLDQRRTDL